MTMSSSVSEVHRCPTNSLLFDHVLVRVIYSQNVRNCEKRQVHLASQALTSTDFSSNRIL